MKIRSQCVCFLGMFMDINLRERLWRFIVTEPNTGCWLWIGGRRGDYGCLKINGKMQLAHRVSYTEYVGLISQGLTLDHLCRMRICINPVHLEPVTLEENKRRGLQGALRRPKTHCINGHAYVGGNIYTDRKSVIRCMECARRGRLRSYYKVKGEKLCQSQS